LTRSDKRVEGVIIRLNLRQLYRNINPKIVNQGSSKKLPPVNHLRKAK